MTENNRSSGSDPIADFQRWLMRSSAKNLGREIKGTFRRTFGGGSDKGDVWDVATTEPPSVTGEAPECAWCPVCRAARRFRESGPGLASHVAGAGDALLSVAQDTISAFEATLSARPPGTGPKTAAGTGWPAEPAGRPAPPAAKPASGRPAPTAPAPAHPAPGHPAPAPSSPTPAPTPSETRSAPGDVWAAASDPVLSDPVLSDPRLSDPRLSDPRPSDPRPSDIGPGDTSSTAADSAGEGQKGPDDPDHRP
jgi:hypothetical protein